MNSAKPFFESTPTQNTSSRLLLVSYHFPPGTAAGALRWEKFSRFFVERGWGLDVIARNPEGQTDWDWERLRDLPRDMRVFGIPEPALPVELFEHAAWQAYRRIRRPRPRTKALSVDAPTIASQSRFAGWPPRRLSDVIRGYYAWLEYARSDKWARNAAGVALQVIKPGSHRAVITCGPPHMTHAAGPMVAHATGLRYIMDLRDPWSLVERLPKDVSSELWLRLARRYERLCVREAALVVLNTELAQRAMQHVYPELGDRCIAVMNGYDDDPLPSPTHDDRFLIAFAGEIYLDRDPRPLLRACARLLRERGLCARQIGVEFIGNAGNFNGYTIQELARREGLEPAVVSTVPFLPRSQLMQRLSAAAVLVSLPQDSRLAIPSKIFEYLRFNAWLLAIEHEGSATELLLRNSGADVVSPDDVEGMTRVLRGRYSEFVSGIRPQPLAGHLQASRRSQAEILLNAIDSIVLDTVPGARAVPLVEG